MSKPTEGWGWPYNARRAHYFRSGRSLCGKWGYFGEVEPDTSSAQQHDCAGCAKVRAKERAEAKAEKAKRKRGSR